MTDEQKLIRYYTPEMVDVAMKIWMHSSVSLIDIRSKKIEQNRPLKDYLLPTSMFIYIQWTPASLRLNQHPFQIDSYGLCHAGKGTLLSILPHEADVQVFMILYRAETTPFYKRHLRELLASINPFTQIYGFFPKNPIFFVEKFSSMLENWNEKEKIHQFYAQALLYQVIHHVHMELRRGDIRYMEPDYVEWVKDYLDHHFTEPVSIQGLTDQLPLSRSLLGRLFRKRENSSLQEYLNKKRLDAAKGYLKNTTMSIQEIAYGCGFLDEINLIRLFKKYEYTTPGEYRRKSTIDCTKNVIDNDSHQLYNEKGLASLVKTQRDGELTMFGQVKGREMILAAAMSLMLLLTACSSNTPINNGGVANQSTVQVQQTTDEVGQTRIVKTVMGDVEVPLNPQHIIVNWYVGDMFTLGFEPAAIYAPVKAAMPFYEAFRDIPLIENWEPEELLTYSPDLIITYDPEDFEKLSKIAPVVVVTGEDYGASERLQFLGESTGRADLAATAIEILEQKVNEAKAWIGGQNFSDKSFNIFWDTVDSGLFYETSSRGGTLIYDYLGLQKPMKLEELISESGNGRGTLSYEMVSNYVGDYVLWFENEADSAFKQSEVWISVPAVKEGRQLSIPWEDMYLFYYNDVASLTEQVDYLLEKLREL